MSRSTGSTILSPSSKPTINPKEPAPTDAPATRALNKDPPLTLRSVVPVRSVANRLARDYTRRCAARSLDLLEEPLDGLLRFTPRPPLDGRLRRGR